MKYLKLKYKRFHYNDFYKAGAQAFKLSVITIFFLCLFKQPIAQNNFNTFKDAKKISTDLFGLFFEK